MSWQQRITTALNERRAADALRTRIVGESDATGFIHQGRRYRNFSGNDYLGLSRHPAIVEAWQQGAQRYGVGSGGSGHVTGFHQAHHQLEQTLAAWLGYPRALLFISGFSANQAVISALMQKEDRIVADRLSHASLLEAASLSPATLRRFHHNDVESLQALLSKPLSGQQLAITEGVFSMDGDRAPLAEIAAVKRNALLMVDDAHGIGVVGEGGRGSCAAANVKPDILVVTFGKAFGLSGAAVLCNDDLADYLVQFARHLIYSTAMPPAQAHALQTAVAVIQQADQQRATLQRHIARFRRQMAAIPLPLAASQTAIQPIIVGDNQRTLQLAASLRERGLWVTAIRPPTVPAGSARLRITLTAAHDDADIDALLEALHDITRE